LTQRAMGVFLAILPRQPAGFMGAKSMRACSTALVVCAALLVPLACARASDTSVLKLPQDIEFKSPLTGPPQTVVLYGDPTKSGVFVTRVKFSAGWKDMPHWHPDEVRTVVVLSGTFYFASGEKWDESKFKAYPAGTFYSEPPKAPHYTWARDGEVIIQVTGIGPSGKTFIPQ
jgi:quercetin dioxygenase-like cupin family protein